MQIYNILQMILQITKYYHALKKGWLWWILISIELFKGLPIK